MFDVVEREEFSAAYLIYIYRATVDESSDGKRRHYSRATNGNGSLNLPAMGQRKMNHSAKESGTASIRRS